MIHIACLAVLSVGLAPVAPITPQVPGKVLAGRNFDEIKRQMETLRGKSFLYSVPTYRISDKELRHIAERELEKQFPGAKLHYYEEMLAWLDMAPPQTDLKSVYGDYLVDQVAGLYDSDTKEMYLPALSTTKTNKGTKTAEKKLEDLSLQFDEIVLAHEFTHALEDQYWPLDDPGDYDFKRSTDRGTAHDFLSEGSATREMIEVIPAQWARGFPGRYFPAWNFIHSGLGELVLKYELSRAWKSPDALSPGVPAALARSEAMPYSFGYTFCTDVMRQWGLDGLDYIYNHPPVSSSQVMHPKKCWEWRDFPVQIDLPESLPGGWKQVSLDTVGEAGIAVLFGCQFKNLNYGLELARGWRGDHVALFENSGGNRLLLWASSWGSTNAASRYARAWVRERQVAQQAVISKNSGTCIEWASPNGRVGIVQRNGKQVFVLESDGYPALQDTQACFRNVAFTEPVEEASRAALNSPLRRFNPVWSWQKDDNYTVTRSLGGLLSRHDRNSVGSADRLLLGLLGESRRTASYHKWELGAGLLAGHESEARRGTTKTSWLPWGLLASHCAARLPESPDKTITRTTVIWGLGASASFDGESNHSVRVLPFGLLFRQTTGPEQSSVHVLGTGLSHQQTKNHSASNCFRVLGIPIWTTHQAGARS